jgi:hypothetical protein
MRRMHQAGVAAAQPARPAWLLLGGWILAGAAAAGGTALLGQFLEDFTLAVSLGCAQTLVLLWYRFPHAGWWAPASLVGSFVVPIVVSVLFLSAVPATLGAGFETAWWAGSLGGGALFQAGVLAAGLEHPRRVALLWLAASVAGSLLFQVMADTAGAFMFQLRDLWTAGEVGALAARQLREHVLAWSVGGALYGLVTGLALLGVTHARHARS